MFLVHRFHSLQSRRGSSLIELVLVIAMLTCVMVMMIPAIAHSRAQMRGLKSADNLQAIGQARDMYAMDHGDRIATYTWRAGETYTMPNGQMRTMSSDVEAASRQNEEILQRRTGRISGADRILSITSVLVHRRYSHLPLMDYMAGKDNDGFRVSEFIDPADQELLNWALQPLDYRRQSNSFPGRGNEFDGYDSSSAWGLTAVSQRWPFTTSYMSTTFAWQGDGPDNVYAPISNTPHLYRTEGTPDISGRYMNEVALPAQKVHLFEEYDREQHKHPYFAYDHAKPEKLMFDGSTQNLPSSDARSSFDPANPNGLAWMQVYIPIDTFPIPLDGLRSQEELNMRYLWTKNGLAGFDYAP